MFRVLLVSAAVVVLPASAAGQPQATDVAAELQRVQALREGQRYREALPAVEALQARSGLSARQRLDVLRELAFVRLILRDDDGARAALTSAVARDPGFDLGPGDHPPRFAHALEEARAAAPESPVTLGTPTVRLADGVATVEVQVTRGAEAVDRTVAYLRAAGATSFEPLLLDGSPARGSRSVAPGELATYVEALAPSGAVLARAGTAESPATTVVPAPPVAEPVAPPPRTPIVPRPAPPAGSRSAADEGGGGLPTWVWIAGGVVLVAGATTAGVLLASPAAPRDGTWGHVELGR